MRLLNTETLEVEEFFKDIPIYAILSHTWEQDEITFRDMQDLQKAKKKAEFEVEDIRRQFQLSKVERIHGKAGWSKIEKACEFVRKFRFKWIWIDTCCIDKSSSAELSEALNSMYRYYGDGRVCIAYLSDVPNRSVMDLDEFRKSRWFERGWTLQELIAPRSMVFLNQEWNMIGTRFSMRHIVAEVTSIPVKVFEDGIVERYSIAQKMSWAASRKTTRDEDMAYCLMGLFGVNMPPIYGEGGVKAFMRLQQEIIKHSDDQSIFAWVAFRDYQRDRGLFASSPSEFASSGEIHMSNLEELGQELSFSFGNNGLHIHLSLQPLSDLGKDLFFASLHCRDANGIIGIYLEKHGQHYIRWCPHLPLHCTDKPVGNLEEVIVKESAVFQQWVQPEEIPFVFKLDSHVTRCVQPGRILIGSSVPAPPPPPPPPLGDDVNLGSPQSLLSVPSYEMSTFRLRTENTNEFDITLYNSGNSIIPVVSNSDHSVEQDDYYPFQDSCLLPIDNENGWASCFVYGTGDSSSLEIIEINYLPSFSPQLKLYRQIDEFRWNALRSATLNFTVDPEHTLYAFPSTSSYYPSDLRWKRSYGGTYGSVSYPSEREDVHCVFQCTPFWFNIPFFITLGLSTNSERRIPWIDTCVSDDLLISDVWQSYQPLGSRYDRRQQNRSMVTLNYITSLDVTVTVEEKKVLDASWYHVVITDSRGFHKGYEAL